MSENNLNLHEQNEIHYVYGDQEFVLKKQAVVGSELGEGEIVCSDGSRAILVDGQYILTDNQTIFLQEGDSNLTQLYINENAEGFVVDGDDSTNTLFQTTECIQFVEEETSDTPQIIYYTNEDSNIEELIEPQQQELIENVEGIQDEEGNIYPFKRIKLEGQFLNFDEFVQQQNLGENNEKGSLEYTILEDASNLSEANLQDESSESATENFENVDNQQVIDLSKITGRNLITGQTVTLHGYMEKLKKRLNKTHNQVSRKLPKKSAETVKSPKGQKEETKKPELCDLLDKKISIGTTKSGKKIVGKIIHVEKRNTQNEVVDKEEEGGNLVINDSSSSNAIPETVSQNDEENPENEGKINEDQLKILVKKSSVSIDSFEQISKTLGGVMEMEFVRKKLENKNIVVKLVEKKHVSESDLLVKNTSYCYGYMEQEFCQGIDGEVSEKWKFVPDQNTQDALLDGHVEVGDEEKKTAKFSITTSLIILITHEKTGHKTIRVNLNPAPGNLCTICSQHFKSHVQLRRHMNQVHNNNNNNSRNCEICEKTFENVEKLQEHRQIHVDEGKLFMCSKCNKCFSNQNQLQKHQPTHDVYLRPLECSVCEVRCASEWALKKHLLIHTGIKPFSCDICQKQFMTQYDMNFHKKIHFPEKHFACNVCMRTFSRHSNLLRHTEIHKGTGALYKCEICYCSYNYISSLTRHMVQNHIEL